ncbi:MAG: YfhO family protein [Acidobacteriota bacterium]
MDTWSPADLLPGISFLLFGGLLLGLLHRRFDAIPRACGALFLALPVLLFGSSLFGGRVLLPLDFLLGFEPFRQIEPAAGPGHPLQGDLPLLIHPSRIAAGDEILAGRWPLWTDHVGAGMGLQADPQAQAFQPLVLAALALSPDQGPALTAALKELVALLFTFLLLRRSGSQPTAATLGACAYGLGSFVILWVGWPLSTTSAVLPAVLYGIEGCRHERGTRFPLLLTAALVTLMLAGHPQTIAFALGFVFLFAAVGWWSTSAPQRGRVFATWLCCTLIAVGITAPLWLPASRLLDLSDRRAVMTGPPAEHGFTFAAAVAPPALGDHRLGAHWGPINRLEDSAAFASTIAWLLALAAGTGGRRNPRELLIAAVAVASLGLAALPTTWTAGFPAIGILFAAGPQRLGFLTALALALLAARAVGRWQQGEIRRRRLVAAAGFLVAALLWAYLAHPPPVAGTLADFRHGWLAAQIGLVVLATVLLLRPPSRLSGGLLVALVAAELLVAHGSANPAQPKRLAFPETPAITELRAASEENPGSRFVALGNALAPNLGSLYGLRDLRINNPTGPAALRRVTAPLRPATGGQRWHLERPEHPLYDLLGVGQVLTPRGRTLPPPLEPRLRHPSGWLWQRPHPLPRLFLPASAERFTGGSWERWLADNHSFAERALVQSMPGDPSEWRQQSPGRLTAATPESTRWSAQLETLETRLVASSIYQDGGWRALIDDRSRPIVLTNGPFVGLWAQPGEQRLELLYRPRTHLQGCLLAALALSFAGAFLGRPRGRRAAERQGR